MGKRARSLLAVALGLLVGCLSFWLVRLGPIGSSESDALCRLELASGQASSSASFTTSGTLQRFNVLVRAGRGKIPLRLSITGSDSVYFRGPVSRSVRFSCGRAIPPGTYHLTLEQDAGGQGGLVIVARNPAGITGWQIYSRGLVVLAMGAALWALIARRFAGARHRMISLWVFHCLLLSVLLIFLYLLLHEGGHALGPIVMGRFDWARSDFFGIGGSPHASYRMDDAVQPWQRALWAIGGPVFPSLVGWALFGLWRSRLGRRLRNASSTGSVYFSSIVAMCVFPFVAMAGCLVGLAGDGDWRGFVDNFSGPLWAAKAVLWCMVAANALILWRVVPQAWHDLKKAAEKLRPST